MNDLIVRDKEILGGTAVFAGTRVPVHTLFDYLEAGDSLDTFLDHFPSVRREQAIALLEILKSATLIAEEWQSHHSRGAIRYGL